MTTDELMAVVCPKIRDLGWAFYFTPETAAVGEKLGLDIFEFYVLGRGGVMGDAPSAVVVSAFGYFNSTMLADLWEQARAKADPKEAASAYLECSAELGREKLTAFHELGVGDLETFVVAADAVNNAADPMALSLYSGISAQRLAGDTEGRAMQLVTVLRELRGSAHLLAIRANGLDGRTAHFISRPNDVALFGWSDDYPPVVTDVERRKWAAAEALTDEIVRPAYAVLDETGATAIIEGMAAIERALTS